MKLELVVTAEFSHVELLKNEKKLIGIKIRDAKEENSGPVIKKIKPKSPAGRSFAITQGDSVLSVNGKSTTGKKCKDVMQMIRDAGPRVSLLLQHKLQEIKISNFGVYRRQHLTIRLQKEDDSFGFTLRKKDSPEPCYCTEYPIISNIKEGSQAYKCNQLQDGDRLISVDDLNLSWLCLDDIATFLQDKNEAQFTFEYNIRVVDFAELEQKLDLEIDAPVSDLGLNFCSQTDKTMHIASIQIGSIAERCGVFSECDVILSINGIDTNLLTPSKAEFLLRNSKKIRKISFIKTRRREVNTIGEPVHTEVSSLASAETTTSGIETTDWKHVNTPASSNIAFSVQQNYYSQKFCHMEQMKAIDKFQNMVPLLSSLKHRLSGLAHEAVKAKQSVSNESCSLCDKTQYFTNVCASCLARMNNECAQSISLLKNVIVQFLDSSTNARSVSPQSITEVGNDKRRIENQSIRFSIESLVNALTEKLPKAFDSRPELKETFEGLAEKVRSADLSCITCDFEVKSVMLIVRKLLLLICLRDNSGEITDLIELLLGCLLETKFTCDGQWEHPLADDYCSSSASENLSVRETENDAVSSLSVSSDVHNNSEIGPSDIQNSSESITNRPRLDTSTNLEYLKIAHIESLTESQNSVFVNEVGKANTDNLFVVKSITVDNSVRSSVPENETPEKEIGGVDRNNYKGKRLEMPRKVCKSRESALGTEESAKTRTAIQNGCRRKSSQSKTTELIEMKSFPGTSSNTQNLTSRDAVAMDGASVPSSSRKSTPPFSRCTTPENESACGKKKVRFETLEVKLKNDGDGFGLGISLQFVESAAEIRPVIHAIKPNSPSYKTGIIKVDDRVVAINHQSTLGLTTKDLVSLKNSAFSSRTVVLTIEFDVIDEEPKFGTFDVLLNKTLKTGLIFKAMKKGSPMIVSGILKGSAAHRCGQLFAEDKILSIKCNRCENFDPITCSYKREENVRVTVQRDEYRDVQKKSVHASPYYINPCFNYEDFVPRNGTNFAVKRTIIRAVENTEDLVFDLEVTLFRDNKFWDFGFLLGESRDTGHSYVADLRPDGPAHQSGVIKKFDRIVEVNGMEVDRNIENSALTLLSQANDKVDLLLRRMYHEGSK